MLLCDIKTTYKLLITPSFSKKKKKATESSQCVQIILILFFIDNLLVNKNTWHIFFITYSLLQFCERPEPAETRRGGGVQSCPGEDLLPGYPPCPWQNTGHGRGQVGKAGILGCGRWTLYISRSFIPLPLSCRGTCVDTNNLLSFQGMTSLDGTY